MTKLKVGIDFGTSNSGVAVYDGHKVYALPINKQGLVPDVIKTIMYITRDQQCHVGREAIDLYYKHNVKRPRRFVKKWVGEIEYVGAEMYYVRDVYVFVDELQPGRLIQFIKTGLRLADYEGTQIFEQYYDLKRLIRVYLQALKTRAEAILNEQIYGVTLGRPVKFLDDPEQDKKSEETLRQAAYEAGFEQVDFELEPVAAALYYEVSLDKPENVLIFDFGGGTLDITIMRLGQRRERKVFATGGIGIAGSDFDRAIIQTHMLPHFGKGTVEANPEVSHLIDALSDWHVLPALSTPRVQHILQEAIKGSPFPTRLKAAESLIYNDYAFLLYNEVEAAKMALSNQGATVIRMAEEDIDIWELLTRSQFEEDIKTPRARIEDCLLNTLVESGLDPEQIDAVIKTGGSSNIPCFTQLLHDIFGPHKVKTSNVFGSVTAGLAVKAFETETPGI
jgi:hypothetical chaperone protein